MNTAISCWMFWNNWLVLERCSYNVESAAFLIRRWDLIWVVWFGSRYDSVISCWMFWNNRVVLDRFPWRINCCIKSGVSTQPNKSRNNCIIIPKLPPAETRHDVQIIYFTTSVHQIMTDCYFRQVWQWIFKTTKRKGVIYERKIIYRGEIIHCREMGQNQSAWNKNSQLFLSTYRFDWGDLFKFFLVNMKVEILSFSLINFNLT